MQHTHFNNKYWDRVDQNQVFRKKNGLDSGS